MKKLFVVLSLIAMLPLQTACIKNKENIGYTFDENTVERIRIGQSRTDYVRNVLGSPSAQSSYGTPVWYYISTEQEHIAFLNPSIKEQKILAITFNDKDIVSDMTYYSSENAKDISFSRDSVPTEGHDMNMLQQLLGNIGRFNSGQLQQ